MKKNLGRKKSRSYAMKGGAGPYVYEVPLTLDNPYTHIAVNQTDDGKYNFNIPEKKTGSFFSKKTTPAVNFTSFCELYQYYKKESPISCVQQRYEKKDGGYLKAPSFVDILGLVLLLMGTAGNGVVINLSDSEFLKNVCNLTLLILNKEPICQDQAGQLLISSTLKTYIARKITEKFGAHEMVVLPIISLEKSQIDRLLGLFKKVLFFYKYNTLPSATYLTFDVMSRTPEEAYRAFGASTTLDSEKFKNDKSSQFRNNSKLYSEAVLQSALSGTEASMALGGRGRRRVKRTNKNRRMRTRTRRTRRTIRRY